jgi:hypothetical protein
MFTRARRLASVRSMLTMSSNTRTTTGTRASSSVPSSSLSARLRFLAEAAQESDHIFASPLGPFYADDVPVYLPRFVYFGPNSSEASLRLALLAGLGRHDLSAAQALVAFVEGLARRPDIGEGVNLSIFPVVNVQRFIGGSADHDLSGAHWGRSAEPEIKLLSMEARVRSYHGFVSVVTTSDETPAARVRTVLTDHVAASDVELFNSEDFGPWSVRFEAFTARAAAEGPLTLAQDLAFAPFEVEISLPAHWGQAHADRSLAALLKRLIQRYRGFFAYGQHL